MPDAHPEIEFIARGVVFHGERVLLCRSVKSKYCYLPGGHVELGEPAATALAREFQEETGLDVAVHDCVLAQEHVFRQKGNLKHELNLVFRVELVGVVAGAPVPSLEPKIEFVWVGVGDLDDHDIRPAAVVPWIRGDAKSRSSLSWQSAISAD